MSNSSLATETFLVPSTLYGSRKGTKISKITIHHQAGHLTALQCRNVWINQYNSKGWQASANYSICDGVIGLLVEESNRAFTSSSKANDSAAVTMEVANVRGAGYSTDNNKDWCVSDTDYEKMIQLCTDICHRNNFRLTWTGDSTGTLTIHRMFTSTHCPGNYLASRMPAIAEEVNRRLDEIKEEEEMTQEKFNEFMAAYLAEQNTKGPSTWAQTAWNAAIKTGITDGSRPQAFITREQVVQMIANAEAKK